eukprot:scaffold78824_cov18-Prasinocladus_malaysianus.AAC.1
MPGKRIRGQRLVIDLSRADWTPRAIVLLLKAVADKPEWASKVKASIVMAKKNGMTFFVNTV